MRWLMPLLTAIEYSEAFGEDTVPYERYLTPAWCVFTSIARW